MLYFVSYAIYFNALFTQDTQRTMFCCISLQKPSTKPCAFVYSLTVSQTRLVEIFQVAFNQNKCINLSANVVKGLWQGARRKALTL